MESGRVDRGGPEMKVGNMAGRISVIKIEDQVVWQIKDCKIYIRQFPVVATG